MVDNPDRMILEDRRNRHSLVWNGVTSIESRKSILGEDLPTKCCLSKMSLSLSIEVHSDRLLVIDSE